jgi:hypothetical protein
VLTCGTSRWLGAVALNTPPGEISPYGGDPPRRVQALSDSVIHHRFIRCPRDLNPHARAFSPILRLSPQPGEKSPVRGFHASRLARWGLRVRMLLPCYATRCATWPCAWARGAARLPWGHWLVLSIPATICDERDDERAPHPPHLHFASAPTASIAVGCVPVVRKY